MKRRDILMLVKVSVPSQRSAIWARREVRYLLKDGAGYEAHAGDPDGVKVKGVYATKAKPKKRERFTF